MVSDRDLTEAEARVAAARAKMLGTARELQARVQPERLRKDAWESAKDASADWAHNALESAKARPWLVGGIVAATALFLARKPVGQLAADAYTAMTKKEVEEATEKDDTLEAEAPNSPVAVARRAKRVAPKKRVRKIVEKEK